MRLCSRARPFSDDRRVPDTESVVAPALATRRRSSLMPGSAAQPAESPAPFQYASASTPSLPTGADRPMSIGSSFELMPDAPSEDGPTPSQRGSSIPSRRKPSARKSAPVVELPDEMREVLSRLD